MPGAVPITSTDALANATLPYVLRLASLSRRSDQLEDAELGRGLNLCAGKVTCRPVAESLGLEYTQPRVALNESSSIAFAASAARPRSAEHNQLAPPVGAQLE
jgi:alanine dehydrogenase